MMVSEKKISQLIKNIFWLIFDKIFVIFLNLVVTVRIANYFGTKEYGTYQYVVSIVAIFDILNSLVDSRVVKKAYISNDNGKVVWNVTFIKIILSIITLITAVIYAFINNETSEFNFLFLILIVNSISVSYRFGMQTRFEYLLRSKKIVIASNIGLITSSFLQLYVIEIKGTIELIAIISLLSSMISLIILLVQYKNDFGITINGLERELALTLLTESAPFVIAAACTLLYSRCDSIMIGNMVSKEDVGIYAIAVKMVSMVQIVLGPIRESVFPSLIKLYNTDKLSYEKKYIQITSVLTWTYIFISFLALVIFQYAIGFLNPEYNKAFPVYKIYVIGTFFMYNAGLRAGHYTLVEKGGFFMRVQIFSVVINLILNHYMIGNYGVYGAATATVITQMIVLLISNLLGGKEGRRVFIWQLKGINPKRIIMR